jgi:hypothetical protein
MLLHRDGLIELNYDPASDVLTMEWPDITSISSPELEFSFSKLEDAINHYDIKKLLIDSRFNKVQVLENAYSELIRNIHSKLQHTRLEKVARLGSLDEAREPKAEQHARQLMKELNPRFAFKNFRDPNEALHWLREG